MFLSIFFLYLTVDLNASPSSAGWYFGVLFFSNQAFALPARLLGDRIGAGAVMAAGCGLELLAYSTLYLSLFSGSAFVACLLLGVGGCLFSANARAAMLGAPLGQPRLAASQQTSFVRWTNLGALLGPLLALAVWRWASVRDGILICSVVELFSATIFLFGNRKVRGGSTLSPAKPVFIKPASRRPDADFLFHNAVAALPVTLAASAPFLVPHLFFDLHGRPDQIIVAQFIRVALIIILQFWAIRAFRPIRNANTYSLVLFFILLSGICVGVAAAELTADWAVVVLFGLVQLAAGSVTSDTVIADAVDGGEEALFGWSKLVMAGAGLVLMPIFAYLTSALSNVMAHAGEIRQELELVSVLIMCSGLCCLYYLASARSLAEREPGAQSADGRKAWGRRSDSVKS
jgi:MFS family permease